VSDGLPAGFFDPGSPISRGRAPGRLDVLGGVADYSGSVVLELPLARATDCAAQPRSDDRVWIWSESLSGESMTPRWEGRLQQVLVGGGESYADVRQRLRADPATAWAAYVAGVLTVLHAEGRLNWPTGFNLHLRSDVPLSRAFPPRPRSRWPRWLPSAPRSA